MPLPFQTLVSFPHFCEHTGWYLHLAADGGGGGPGHWDARLAAQQLLPSPEEGEAPPTSRLPPRRQFGAGWFS